MVKFEEDNISTENEEKSDSFNFGCLLYRMIYEKEPFNIKYSTLTKMDTKNFVYRVKSNILAPELNSVHKLELMKLLFYFCLTCLNWNN